MTGLFCCHKWSIPHTVTTLSDTKESVTFELRECAWCSTMWRSDKPEPKVMMARLETIDDGQPRIVTDFRVRRGHPLKPDVTPQESPLHAGD